MPNTIPHTNINLQEVSTRNDKPAISSPASPQPCRWLTGHLGIPGRRAK